MKANELLYWISARREGSWQRFREAVEELHSTGEDEAQDDNGAFPMHQQLRLNLERLAHVEFFATDCADGWRVAPPILAAHPTPHGIRAVLCGARSPTLNERLVCAAGNLKYESIASHDAPNAVRLLAEEPTAFSDVCARAGVRFQPDAPLGILTHLPPCDPPSRRSKQAEFPVGTEWNIHEFDAEGLCWKAADLRRAQTVQSGAFRFTHRFQRPSYFLRWAGVTHRVPRAIAIFVVLRRQRRGLLRYDAATQNLDLPAICRPPRLLERSLVLCSGMSPVFSGETGRLIYSEVPPDIARFAAELLRQGLS